MTTQKRTYLPEFKREALQLWQSSGKSASAIENELGITPRLSRSAQKVSATRFWFLVTGLIWLILATSG